MPISRILMPTMIAITLTTAAPSFAEPRTARVRTDDLNLSHTSGRQTLTLRIDRAAKNVCRTNNASGLSDRRMESNCITETRSRAMAQVDKRIALFPGTRSATTKSESAANPKK